MSEANTLTRDDVIKLVASREWYHRYEVYPGVITPGRMPADGKSILNAKSILDDYGFPQDITGKRVLEIGTWDGPYTFEMERRGGIVTAMDIQDKDRTGFAVAHKINQSKATYIQSDVTLLNPEKHGKFDIVLYVGVYYHILHPLLAFQNIFNVLEDGGIMYYGGHILDYSYNIDNSMAKYKDELMAIVDKIPITLFARECHAEVWSNWYIPNKLCLNDWISTAGFKVFMERYSEPSSSMGGAARKIPGFKLAPKCYEYRWQNIIAHKQDVTNYRKILFFGAGGRFENLQDEIQDAVPPDAIVGVLDNDPAKWGKTIAGHTILNPQDIITINPDVVIITSAYAQNILSTLEDMKLAHSLSFDIVFIDDSEQLDMSTGHEVY